jgi:hypothetical protein
MGIPGLYNVLTKTYGDSIYSSQTEGYTCVAIDGNVLLYQFLEVSKELNPRAFCAYLTEYVSRYRSITRYVIAFDGLPPHAKLREQTKRRKYRELMGISSISLTYSNRNILATIEQELALRGWLVISHSVSGEGEQKLANFIHSSADENTLVVTRDWDFLLMLLPLSPTKRIHLDMMFIKKIINVSSIMQVVGIDKILHFTSCVILFGTDFFPGVSNIPLTEEYLRELLRLEPWSVVINHTVVILRKQFLIAIDVLLMMYKNQYKQGCTKCTICVPPYNDKNSILSFICNYAWTIGYFYLRNHSQVEVSESNQSSTNDLGVNLMCLKEYFTCTVRSYISVDVMVDVIDGQSYDCFLSNVTNVTMEVLPPCAFNVKPYCPFLVLKGLP